MLESLFNKETLLKKACNFFIKILATQVFSFEYWETFQNSFFCRTPPLDAVLSVLSQTMSKTCFTTLCNCVLLFIFIYIDKRGDNVEKWPKYLKDLVVFTPHDF